MKIAVEGCCHGELDKIYETLTFLEKANNIKVDLLLICGDFQAVRNKSDLQAMAVPPKYQKLNTFYKYYSGEKKAPVLTIFIGGNHEASNYLQELPYGGWVAPNIYYMGYGGIVNFGGIRIGGVSGIFKGRDYNTGHFEHPPYNENTKRSCYHVRNLEVFRFKQVRQHVDIMLSHDWPRGIHDFGDVDALLRRKSFFRSDIDNGVLGSPVLMELLNKLKPDYWFAAHLHVKFPALVKHKLDDGGESLTKFLSLDKCLPRREFLQVFDFPNQPDKVLELELDPEWLSILKSTNHLLNLTRSSRYMPGVGGTERSDYSVTDQELKALDADFDGLYKLPENFEKSVPPYDPKNPSHAGRAPPPQICINPQTTLICEMLGITDPYAVFSGKQSHVGVDQGQNIPDEGHDSPGCDDEGILDDSDFIDSTMDVSVNSSVNTTINSTFEHTGNPDEISLDDIDNDVIDEEGGPLEAAGPAEQRKDLASFRTPALSNPNELSFDTMDDVTSASTNQSKEKSSESMDASTGSLSPSSAAGASPQKTMTSGPVGDAPSVQRSPTRALETEPLAPGPSQPKKFKRRNQAIYTSGEDTS